MTTVLLITPVVAAEAARGVYTPTTMTRGFSRLLVALSALIEAERDIEDVDIWDPAFDSWLRDAEHALKRVTTVLRTVRGTALSRSEDGPLRRMACLIGEMITSEDPDVFLARYLDLQRDRSGVRCPGYGVVAQRVNAMVAAGLARIDDLASLGSYIDVAVKSEPAPESGPLQAIAC